MVTAPVFSQRVCLTFRNLIDGDTGSLRPEAAITAFELPRINSLLCETALLPDTMAEEILLHKQSDGATSSWIHSIVWDQSNSPQADRGSLIVRILEDDTKENTKDARFTPYLYEDIHADWFLDIRLAYDGKVDRSVGSVVNELIRNDETADAQTPNRHQ